MNDRQALQAIEYLHRQQTGKYDELCTCELFWPCKTAEVLAKVEDLS